MNNFIWFFRRWYFNRAIAEFCGRGAFYAWVDGLFGTIDGYVDGSYLWNVDLDKEKTLWNLLR